MEHIMRGVQPPLTTGSMDTVLYMKYIESGVLAMVKYCTELSESPTSDIRVI